LRKHIDNAAWYEFVVFLTYKAQWYGKEVNKIWRFYPSSKTCSHCGYINQGLKLCEREWKCPRCETMLDRDLNAAINILAEGKRNFAAAISENKHGEGVRPKRRTAKASL
jgi:putative transposase